MTTSGSAIAQNSSITFTATVTPTSGNITPVGSVTFADGQTIFGSANIDGTGKASFTTTALAFGARSITAAYGGSSTYLGSISPVVTVNVPPAAASTATTTNLTASATTATAGTSITFTATVQAASGTATPTGTVTFLDGSTTLGTGALSSGVATLSTSALAVGTHNVTASYGGATTFSSSASGNSPVVITAAPASDFSISLSPATATVVHCNTATSTVTLTPSGGFKQSGPTRHHRHSGQHNRYHRSYVTHIDRRHHSCHHNPHAPGIRSDCSPVSPSSHYRVCCCPTSWTLRRPRVLRNRSPPSLASTTHPARRSHRAACRHRLRTQERLHRNHERSHTRHLYPHGHRHSNSRYWNPHPHRNLPTQDQKPVAFLSRSSPAPCFDLPPAQRAFNSPQRSTISTKSFPKISASTFIASFRRASTT